MTILAIPTANMQSMVFISDLLFNQLRAKRIHRPMLSRASLLRGNSEPVKDFPMTDNVRRGNIKCFHKFLGDAKGQIPNFRARRGQIEISDGAESVVFRVESVRCFLAPCVRPNL